MNQSPRLWFTPYLHVAKCAVVYGSKYKVSSYSRLSPLPRRIRILIGALLLNVNSTPANVVPGSSAYARFTNPSKSGSLISLLAVTSTTGGVEFTIGEIRLTKAKISRGQAK